MISHVIGTLSDKSVFGLCGPKYIWYVICILQWTICRKFWIIFKTTNSGFKVIYENIKVLEIQNIICSNNYIFLKMNLINVFSYNQQITKRVINKLYIYLIIK